MKHTFDFLSKLKNNNNRPWFTEHKADFEKSQEEVKLFSSTLTQLMNTHDQIDLSRSRVYRIYRDVRFSKDKTPFKTNRSGGFGRATKQLRGGYYFSIEPGNSYLAGGFFGPNAQDLLHIRKQISGDPDPLREILAHPDFIQTFGTLHGEQLKTIPRGFEKDDPAADLLRYKQFIVEHRLSDKEVLSSDFAEKVNVVFKKMRPYFDYMSEILTTDLNGEPLL